MTKLENFIQCDCAAEWKRDCATEVHLEATAIRQRPSLVCYGFLLFSVLRQEIKDFTKQATHPHQRFGTLPPSP